METSPWQGAWGEAWTCHRRLQADPDPTTGAAMTLVVRTARAQAAKAKAVAMAKAKETGRGRKVARMVAVEKVVAIVRKKAAGEEEVEELEALVHQAILEVQQHPKRHHQRVQRKTLMGTSTPARALSMWCA